MLEKLLARIRELLCREMPDRDRVTSNVWDASPGEKLRRPYGIPEQELRDMLRVEDFE